ncbi:MAG: hypothetical protein II453_19435 [Alphaproteobacteria bacterium]|nr:hypothetical protein [Alphaproteobacteria bacterium]
MYKAPNGMIFNSYEESIKYCKKTIDNEIENFRKHSGMEKDICKNCGEECDRMSRIYFCKNCGEFTVGEKWKQELELCKTENTSNSKMKC